MDTNEMIALLLPPNGCFACSDTRKEIAEELARRSVDLERECAAAVADGLRALDADVIGTGPARKPKRDHGGSTHWDIADAGAVCHDECAVAQIKAAALAMRERCAQACEELSLRYDEQESEASSRVYADLCRGSRNGADACAAAIRALEP